MSYHGMNAQTGRGISDVASIEQSIADILATPINSRVMRRDYGSMVPDLIDAPTNAYTLQLLRAASIMAILRWEKRIAPTRITFTLGDTAGALTLELEADRVDDQRDAVSLSVPLRGASA